MFVLEMLGFLRQDLLLKLNLNKAPLGMSAFLSLQEKDNNRS